MTVSDNFLNADYEFKFPSKLSECGVTETNDDNTAGTVTTLIPYKENLQCTWTIGTNCNSLQWRFNNFSVEDAIDWGLNHFTILKKLYVK